MLTLAQPFLFKDAGEQWNDEIAQPLTLAANSLGVLRQKLQALLKDGYPSLAQAAAATKMSCRSFQRQLARNHLTYSLLIDQVRLEIAIRLLQDPTLKIIEIAFELGYEDPGNFSRAFKRWTGSSPSTFRHIHLNT
jgi:AraC-like DNA-binding protein